MILNEPGLIEYIVIAGYFAMLIGIGFIMKKLNSNVSDYFRSGCRGSWYLVGASAFMAAFSAWTFTGAAGVAYESGWSVMVIYAANAFGFFLNFLFLAPWFRQVRAITAPEVIRKRFGPGTQQFYAGFSVITQLLYGALHLYGLALFSSSVFGFPIHAVIVVIGFLVLFYSLTGGSWAVMSTDFLQSLILIPLTLLVCFLCLKHLGGFGGLLDAIQSNNLTEDYHLVNSPGRFSANAFTWTWAAAMFLKNIIGNNTLVTAPRYFSVKDGREARKAALFACILMLFGTIVWVIPPMAARMIISDQVAAVDIAKPAEASYALISMTLLPKGLVGLMVVAIFAATISSMDTGLNRNAAIVTQDIYPALCRLFGKTPADAIRRLWIGRAVTLLLGVCIICLSLYFSGQDGKGIFEFMLAIGAMLSIPLMVPMLLCLFVRRVPAWAAMVSALIALIPSVLGFYSQTLFGEKWTFQQQVFINLAVGTLTFFASAAFWKSASQTYREKVDLFFTNMHTPVDFEKEVGEANDSLQLKTLGTIGSIAAAFIALLVFIPNELDGRLEILAISGFIGSIAGLMLWGAHRKTHQANKDSL